MKTNFTVSEIADMIDEIIFDIDCEAYYCENCKHCTGCSMGHLAEKMIESGDY